MSGEEAVTSWILGERSQIRHFPNSVNQCTLVDFWISLLDGGGDRESCSGMWENRKRDSDQEHECLIQFGTNKFMVSGISRWTWPTGN